jgi:hypothetical protein
MLTLAQCCAVASLASDESYVGVTPCVKHRALLDSYLANMWRGPEVVCDMIIGDLRRCIDLGAKLRAADLLIVLRQFLSDHPCATSLRAFEKRNDISMPDGSARLSRHCARARSADRAGLVAALARRLRRRRGVAPPANSTPGTGG